MRAIKRNMSIGAKIVDKEELQSGELNFCSDVCLGDIYWLWLQGKRLRTGGVPGQRGCVEGQSNQQSFERSYGTGET